MKLFTFLALVLTSSFSMATEKDDCYFDKEQTVVREPIIREIK